MANTAMPQQVFDIAIVGGGLVGASLAAALRGSHHKVLLVEAFAPDSAAQPSFDERTTALGNASRRIFEGLGVWQALLPQAAAITRIHVSDAGRFGTALLVAEALDVAALGYVVPNRAIGHALWQSLAGAANLSCAMPARLETVTLQEDCALVGIVDAQGRSEARARLVIAADGVHSQVRAAARIGMQTHDYGQHAIVAALRTDRSNDGTAFERFTAAGPMALLPLTVPGAAGWRTLVWAARPEDARRLMALEPESFLASWQQAFGWRAGRALQLGPRNVYPLALSRADASHAPRVALIGNAAQAQHPVAGQGFNLGLRDAAELAERLLIHRGDPGDPALLAGFAAAREADRRGVMQFTDTLVRAFSDQRHGVGALRDAGLLFFDLLPPAKRLLSRVSLGFGGSSPRLARGAGLP
ncbi:MAG: 2-octaprenyl-6-methoxyphenyl hydroxylase [Steroidobacteraceae bacterium]